MLRTDSRRSASHSPVMFWLTLGYAALIVYGTLFPLDEWQTPLAGWVYPITLSLPHQASRADLLVNLTVYIPLGLFMCLWLRPRLGWLLAVVVAGAAGTGLSFALETLQSALPSRVPSRLDWLSNSGGTIFGALLAVGFDPRIPLARRLHAWRTDTFAAGALGSLALVVLGMWALSQAAPFVPSLDWGDLKTGLKPLANTLRHPHTLQAIPLVAAGLTLFGLGLLAQLAARRSVAWPFILFALAVLLYKVPVVDRQLTLEALLGWVLAAALLLVFHLRNPGALAMMTGAALLTAHALAQFSPGAVPTTFALNWIPFKGQVGSLEGMADILETLWPFVAIGLAARWLTPWRWRRLVGGAGGLLLITFAFALEWVQQSIPGRYPDITDALLAGLGWVLPWLFTDTRGQALHQRAEPLPRQARWALPVLATGLLSLGVVGWNLGSAVQVETDERGRAMLPAPENLAPIFLPGFKHSHPRLPHPSATDIARLRYENPEWLAQMRTHARNGDLYAITVMAYIEPGSQDLGLLHERLMQTRYSFRGEQVKPVALAYDWLYAQWSEAERALLRDKLAEGVVYLVNLIRRERLSPYNVILYNRPFQSLMAANLALYGDDPRGELYMRFTYDLWKHRVLPVWRQVMGQQGGWHEGGEYVGIGIGQAIYRVPAMWRAATGEDLFKTEPGIRGFLDFVVYRRQPDGTDFRWGNAAFFDRIIPDLNALALEYRHAAAYNLRPPRPKPEPTSWPWGPLSDASLLNPDARLALPLTRRFDGIGLVVARSDWSADATYVSFKAGDNFWSHSHLDQGAFAIHKRGGLALDSGLYGPQHGSDHHTNYTYQSIAHNLVTVTDPGDTAESAGKIVRRIANDGGQRRIGSGWGLASAPIDLTEWLDHRDLYHTGRIAAYAEAPDYIVAVSDVTPAYTHRNSGSGEFSHRTRRVERLWRTFVYDRAADLVIVFDVVDATRPEFKKRWLLHTTGQPMIAGSRFTADTGRAAGGVLHGEVLLPRTPQLNLIGGPGFEFWVDGKNYDEGGTLDQVIARHPTAEPGRWRIELSPATASRHDQFLVVLAPRTRLDEPPPPLRALSQGHLAGVEITTANGPRRWWFDPDTGNVQFESATDRRLVEARLALETQAPGWLPEWAASLWRRWVAP